MNDDHIPFTTTTNSAGNGPSSGDTGAPPPPHQPSHLPEMVHLQLLPEDSDTRLEKKEEAEKLKKKEEEEAEEEETKRVTWSNKREYVLSVLGYSVGLGNVFRFPYLCNRNGGGAFLIPFLICLMLIGLPLFAMEVVMGQFSGRNVHQIWAVCPLFKGAGVAMMIVSSITFWYYNTPLSWAFYYLISSCRSVVPWSLCGQWWNTAGCYTNLPSSAANATTSSSSASGNASSALSEVMINGSFGGKDGDTFANGNLTGTGSNATTIKLISSAEEFWQHNVLQLSSGLGDPGSVVWYLALTLTLTAFICFCALVKGILSSGKVVYVTATAPYILLTILLVRGAILPGAVDGVIFYLKPDFAKLLDPQVWIEAAMQVFFSLGPCWGGLVVTASYNKFHNNCLRDSLILTLVSEGTSVYGGFAIFSVLGYMAHVSGQAIDKVVSSGPGLAFIVYPEALSLMPLPQLWAVLFFLNIVSLGIDSQITNAEVLLTTIIDISPRFLRRHRAVITAAVCCTFLVIGLPFVTQGGMYVFQLVDWFVGALGVITIGFLECLVLGWIYGMARLGDDIHLMIGRRPPFILCLFVKYITPFLLLALFVATIVNYTPPTYGDYEYGPGGRLLGWCVAMSSVLPIPTVAVYQLYRVKGTFGQRLRQTLKPDYSVWRPSDATARVAYRKEHQHF